MMEHRALLLTRFQILAIKIKIEHLQWTKNKTIAKNGKIVCLQRNTINFGRIVLISKLLFVKVSSINDVTNAKY